MYSDIDKYQMEQHTAEEIADLEQQRTRVLHDLTKIIRKYSEGPARDRAICDIMTVLVSACIGTNILVPVAEVHKSYADIETEMFNNSVIKYVDECIVKYCKSLNDNNYMKYDNINEALTVNRDGIFISVNGACYLFNDEEIYKEFLMIFQLHVLHKFKNELVRLHIQHITLPNMKQKALLTYNSSDDAEIEEAIIRLSDISDELLESISIVKKDNSTKIIMHNIVGTPSKLYNELSKYCAIMKEQYGDMKLTTDNPVVIGGLRCYFEQLSTIVLGKYGDRMLSPMFNIIVDRTHKPISKKCDTDEDTDGDGDDTYINEWIEDNPPQSSEDTKQYYRRFKKYARRHELEVIGSASFAKYMDRFDYETIRKAGKYYWVMDADADYSEDAEGDEGDVGDNQ